jgi:hypothetical protein
MSLTRQKNYSPPRAHHCIRGLGFTNTLENYVNNCRFGSSKLRDFFLGKKKILVPDSNVMRSVGPYMR